MRKSDIMWQPKILMTPIVDKSLETLYNLWLLAGEILEAGEITDVLFKKIGKALAEKIWFWESIKVGLDGDG